MQQLSGRAPAAARRHWPQQQQRRPTALPRPRCAPTAAARAAPPGRAEQQQPQLVLEGDSYEAIVDQLAHHIVKAAAAASDAGSSGGGRRFMVGLAGGPGSGKTMTAGLLCDRINALLCGGGGGSDSSGAAPAPACAVVPMDGFHYYRRQLDAMPDPQLAHARRGAHWTFDAEKFVACVARVRDGGGGGGDGGGGGGAVLVPSFDHAVGDVSLAPFSVPACGK